MSRVSHAGHSSKPNQSVAPRATPAQKAPMTPRPRARLAVITNTINWDDLPTLPSETGKEQPLEFALTGGVNRAKR
jgi:hypothetical protein